LAHWPNVKSGTTKLRNETKRNTVFQWYRTYERGYETSGSPLHFMSKKIIFFPILGGGGRAPGAPPGSTPAYIISTKIRFKQYSNTSDTIFFPHWPYIWHYFFFHIDPTFYSLNVEFKSNIFQFLSFAKFFQNLLK
jgi:hypothetical protein